MAAKLKYTKQRFREMQREVVRRSLVHLSRRLPNAKGMPSTKNVRQILVFGDMGIGNFVMFTPALRLLRSHFPNAELVLLFLAKSGADQIAGRLDCVDRVEVVPVGKVLSMWDTWLLLREAKARRFDPDLIVCRFNTNPLVPMLIVRLNAPWRVGHGNSAGFESFCEDVFNLRVPMGLGQHEVDRNLGLVRRLGVSEIHSSPEFPLRPADFEAADRLLTQRGWHGTKVICLQVGSSQLQSWKRWPEDLWRQTAMILAEQGFRLAFLGSADESATVRSALSSTPLLNENRAWDACGALSLFESAALIQQSALLVCNDSGLMHVAAAIGAPLVVIMGPTDYDRTRPYTPNATVLRNQCRCNDSSFFDRRVLKRIKACERPCLTATRPETVARAAIATLGTTNHVHNAAHAQCYDERPLLHLRQP